MRRAQALVLASAVAAGCQHEPEELPPFGEATLYVDTDLPVPHVAARVRVDVYSEQGQWIESRDIARLDAQDWPLSFTVYSEDTRAPRRVWVRVRAYPEGRIRDYRGERLWEWLTPREMAPLAEPTPRLVSDGRDVTPATEPLPWLTVDRLVLVEVIPERTGGVIIELSGECLGTMAKLSKAGGQGPVLGEAESCVSAERQRVLVAPLRAEAGAQRAQTRAGSFRRVDCPAAEQPDRVCIPGGAGLFGQAELLATEDLPTTPERGVTHRPFYIDRYEFSVARYREALAQGFERGVNPLANNGPLGTAPDLSTCTYSDTPMGREDFAVTCVTSTMARLLCQFFGGDLPTEVEWETAATELPQGGRSRYPWGDEGPTCQHAIHGRLALAGTPGVCEALGLGPQPIGPDTLDVTPRGVVGLAGGVGEWTLDSAARYDDPCWDGHSMHDASCQVDTPTERIARGGSWAAPPPVLRSALRFAIDASGAAPFFGFRCVYPLPGGG